MDKNEKVRMLQQFDEKTLTKKFIIPLYESEGMGYKNIRYTHGTLEFGKDVVCYKEDEYGDRIYVGIQVKKTKIEKNDASKVLSQILEAFSEPLADSDGKKKKVDRVILLTSSEFTEGARRFLASSLKTAHLDKQLVKCIDGNQLVGMLDSYLPSAFWDQYDCFVKYNRAMKKEFETIKDVSAIGQREPIPLDEIYVSLRLSESFEREIPQGEPEKEIEEEMIEEKMERGYKVLEEEKLGKERVFDADDAVRKFNRAVIVGSPGSGKTTLLKHLALKSCKEDLEKQERITVPILVTLKQFSESGKTLVKYIEDVFEQFDFPEAINFFEKDLKEGGCLLLFDGFDELATLDRQQKAAEEIEEFVSKYYKNRFIITSRTAGYHDELKRFQKLEVMPFDDHQITQFITNWFGKLDPAKSKLMGESIKENERIRELARNPLMIAITAIIYEEDRQLPQRRAELYERCVEVLLSKWDVAHRIKNKYDSKAKQKILRKIALEAHIQKKRSFAKEELLEKFVEYLPEVKIEKEKAEDVLKEIVERNALLKEISIGVYDFLHLSFQEYLTALELWERRDYQTLLQYLYEPWWEEVVLLFAGFDRDATDLIAQIKKKEKEDERFEEDIFYNNLMLLGMCIADADYTDVKVKDEITNDLWHLYETGGFFSLRERAMRILALIKPDGIIDSMIENLKDKDSDIRGNAAFSLGKIGSERAIDPLIDALTSDIFSNVRTSAAEALKEIGSEKAVDPLVKALATDPANDVRWSAADALGKIGSEKAVDPLIKVLTSDEFSSVRLKAVDTLGEIGSEKAINALIEALEDENDIVRKRVVSALGEVGSEKAVDPLVRMLATDSASDVRWNIADALGKIGSEKAIDPLARALAIHKNSIFRWNITSALGKIGSEKAIGPLIRALISDRSVDVRRGAAFLLGKIGSEKVVDPLIEALTSDEDNYVRWNIVSALGEIGSEKVVDPLIEALTSDESSDVRRGAAFSLGKIGSEKVVDPLIKALTSDRSRYVRRNAAIVLGEIGSERAIDPLIDALTSDISSDVRTSAAEALKEIGGEKAVDPLVKALEDEDRSVRMKTAYLLGKIGSKKSVDPLIKVLTSEDDGIVRGNAAFSLGKIGSERAIGPLIEVLTSDEDNYVRRNIASALGEIGSEKAVDPLIKVLATDSASDVRWSAASALGEIGSERAISPLRVALKDEGVLMETGRVKDRVYKSLERISKKRKIKIALLPP